MTQNKPERTHREKPYIWVTFVNRLLAGQSECHRRPWLDAHYMFPARADDTASTYDHDKHTALIRERVQQLRADGWRVTLEGQNTLKVTGQATVSGRPDIIADKADICLVVDAKGGRVGPANDWQVREYMALLWKSVSLRFIGKHIHGEVYYGGDTGAVPVTLSPEQADEIYRQFDETGNAPEMPEATPSEGDCRYCKAREWCDARWQKADAIQIDAGGNF